MSEIPEEVSIRTRFLSYSCQKEIQVSIFLVNGIKLLGRIIDFDAFSIKLMHQGSSLLVYKHAISTIMLDSEVELTY